MGVSENSGKPQKMDGENYNGKKPYVLNGLFFGGGFLNYHYFRKHTQDNNHLIEGKTHL